MLNEVFLRITMMCQVEPSRIFQGLLIRDASDKTDEVYHRIIGVPNNPYECILGQDDGKYDNMN